MKKIPLKYVVMLVAVIGLLAANTVYGIRSELIVSSNYDSQFEMHHIGITLLENYEDSGYKDVGHRNYVYKETEEANDGQWSVASSNLLGNQNETVVLNKEYKEFLKVQNSGSIDEYVRVKIYKYWIDKNGKKDNTLSPALIELGLVTDGEWLVDDSADRPTAERTIMYYRLPLKSGETTTDFMKSIKINGGVMDSYTFTVNDDYKDGVNYKKYTYNYKYDGYTFCLEVEADAVQTHNVEKAMKSTWGRIVNFEDVVIDGVTVKRIVGLSDTGEVKG